MTLREAKNIAQKIIASRTKTALMLWGPPGLGKSSLVAEVAKESGLAFIDLRLSQLAPTDLRGLPVADHQAGIARWFPPEFLPQSGEGILFLDELNMAPPTMQGVAQQLILDRRVGSYELPEGWFVWGAGNRKEDRAAVSSMPAPLANRFIHLEVEADVASFSEWAIRNRVYEGVIAFLRYKPQLLHRMDDTLAWPSPRSWVVAGELHRLGINPQVVIGKGAAQEFLAFMALQKQLPDLDSIVAGRFKDTLSSRPDVLFATVSGLAALISNAQQLENCVTVISKVGDDWAMLLVGDVIGRIQAGLVEEKKFRKLGPTTQRLAELSDRLEE